MDKKGQFFAMYLLVLTVTMCILVILLYLVGQSKSENSLISPKAVLEVRDDLMQFELKEKELILESLDETGSVFGSEEFAANFRQVFLGKLIKNSEMKEFLFENMILEDEARESEASFFSSLYSAEFDGDKLAFYRGSVEKEIYLKAKESSKINFPFEFTFEFDKKYLISYDGYEYKPEAA